MTEQETLETLDQVAQAIVDTKPELVRYATEHPRFKETGESMLHCWEEGVEEALRVLTKKY